MPLEMNVRVQDELDERMARFPNGKSNATEYDKRANLFSQSTQQISGGWLRNLLGKAFLKISNPGATTLAVAQVTGSQLTCAALGDVGIAVYRFGESKEIYSSTLKHISGWIPHLFSGSD